MAVYHDSGGRFEVVSPCGMRREMISNYAPDAAVIMPDGDGACSRRPIASLLPGKHRRSALLSPAGRKRHPRRTRVMVKMANR